MSYSKELHHQLKLVVATGKYFADSFSRYFSLEVFTGHEIAVSVEPCSNKTPQAVFALEASIGFSGGFAV